MKKDDIILNIFRCGKFLTIDSSYIKETRPDKRKKIINKDVTGVYCNLKH